MHGIAQLLGIVVHDFCAAGAGVLPALTCCNAASATGHRVESSWSIHEIHVRICPVLDGVGNALAALHRIGKTHQVAMAPL